MVMHSPTPDYTEAIWLNPKYADAFVNRGVTRAESGDRQGAIADLQQAATLAHQQGNWQLYQFAVKKLSRLGVSVR
jgi:tetratricopeptide (TPR) repeat protein